MASALENFVNSVRSRSSSGAFEELATQLIDSVEILTKNWSILDNVLETLDIQQHSLGVLYVLIAKFNSIASSNADVNVLFKLFKDFIEQCNVYQVGLAVHAYYELCHLFANTIVTQPRCIHGINILATAINNIRSSDTQLTPIHADLCMLSLKAKCFRVALKYLDVDITTISTGADTRGQNQTEAVNNDAKYFLLYYYYGGMIYTAVKNYERALYFFEVCTSTPALALSFIMVAAYKKFVLVSLIVRGKITSLPKWTAQIVNRNVKPMCTAYHAIAYTYCTTTSPTLHSYIYRNREEFQNDKNMGLVKQVATSLYKKNIQKLTKTFLTLSLSDVASRVNLPSANAAEKYILNMIKSGEIYATINQKDGMVIFKDDPEKYNSPEMFLNIQNDMDNVMMLVKELNKMEVDIILNPSYIKKAVGNQDDDLASQHVKSFAGDPID